MRSGKDRASGGTEGRSGRVHAFCSSSINKRNRLTQVRWGRLEVAGVLPLLQTDMRLWMSCSGARSTLSTCRTLKVHQHCAALAVGVLHAKVALDSIEILTFGI